MSRLQPKSKTLPRQSPSRPPPPPPPPKPPLSRTIFRTTKTIALTLAVLITIRDHVFSIDTVKGSSMSPTLSPTAHETGKEDWVIIKRWKATEHLKRGDVVTFWKPHRPNEVSIKRVVGLGGDVVYPRDRGAQGRYGRKKVGEDKEGEDDGQGDVKVVVPYGHVWVEGDNWRRSFDSNDFGPISKALIDGKAVRLLRGWRWQKVGEKKEDAKRTRVVEGLDVIPQVYLE